MNFFIWTKNFVLEIPIHGKTKNEWHTNEMRVHRSEIRLIYKYIWVTYRWHMSTYEWHTDDIRVNTSDIRVKYEYIQVHTSDIRVTYEYIRVRYEWHTSVIRHIRMAYEWHMNDIRMTNEWYTNDIRMIYKWRIYSVWSFSIVVFNILCGKNIALRGCEWFWLLGCSNLCIFHWNTPYLAKNFEKYHCNQKQV